MKPTDAITNEPPPKRSVPANFNSSPTTKPEPDATGTIESIEPVPVTFTTHCGATPANEATGVNVYEPATKS